MPFASFRLGRLAPFVLPAALALGLGFGCTPEVTPDDDDPGAGATSGSGGASAGSGGAMVGGSGGTGASGGVPTGGTGGVGGAGGASGGSAGVTGGIGGSAGMGVGGTAGTAGQLGGAGSAGAPGGTGGTLGGDAGTGAQGGAGVAGDSGAAGSTAGAGGSGTPPTGFLIEDFETATDGQAPAGWDTFIAWNKNGQNPSGGAQALVESTRAHSGTKSVHFIGGSNPAQLTRPLPNGTNKLYVRAWFYMTRQLGMNPGANHETLIGIRKLTGGANDEVRFGEIKGVIGTNEVPTDNISPKMDVWGMGPVVSANAWHCIEVAFLGDGAQHTLHAWADGTLVHEVTAGDQWQNGAMPANWLDGKFVEVVLGWHSFSSANNDVWMDDLILSTSPIGC